MAHEYYETQGPPLAIEPVGDPSGAARLTYVGDPMCSWCFGFEPQWQRIRSAAPKGLASRRLLGGLAPDSSEPMQAATRAYIQDAWRSVEEVTGVSFNHSYWDHAQPRRSTWPACRLVLAAESERVGAGAELYAAIQTAYYEEAQDPSQESVLVALAELHGFQGQALLAKAGSASIRQALAAHREVAQALGIQGFPSLVLEQRGRAPLLLMRGFAPATQVLSQLERVLGGH